jgi:hypothetical protein
MATTKLQKNFKFQILNPLTGQFVIRLLKFVISGKSRKGQGMLETVVAMTVLLTGITTLMSLVIMSSVGRRSNEFQTVAANLAREGIEVVVMKRNDNWIKALPFDDGFDYGVDYTYAPLFDPLGLAWTLCPDPTTIDDAEAQVFRYTAAGDFPGLMYQTVGGVPESNSEDSGYRRLLTLDRICYDGSTEWVVTSNTACSGVPGKIGIRVTSTVQWKEHNGNHSISAVESIYDWR